jgi:hypothetical protein
MSTLLTKPRVGKNEFKINQYVFVEIPDELRSNDTEVQFWVARILEIRAGSKRHVYLRVYWMYRPEDLPGGRQLHHGECELIASNHMDIIEVASVHEPVDVYHWNEDANDETIAWPAEEQLFWRQTFDVTKHPGKSGQGQFSVRTCTLSFTGQRCCAQEEPETNCLTEATHVLHRQGPVSTR